MTEDLELKPETELSKDALVAAIEAVGSQGRDINPYTVADELGVPVAQIYSKGEWMELLSLARGEVNGIISAEYDRLLKEVSELKSNDAKDQSLLLAKLQAENQEIAEKNGALAAEIIRLERERSNLENANQIIAQSVHEAWKQGYESARSELQSEIQRLKDEMAATTNGADHLQNSEEEIDEQEQTLDDCLEVAARDSEAEAEREAELAEEELADKVEEFEVNLSSLDQWNEPSPASLEPVGRECLDEESNEDQGENEPEPESEPEPLAAGFATPTVSANDFEERPDPSKKTGRQTFSADELRHLVQGRLSKTDEIPEDKKESELLKSTRTKFVGGKATQEHAPTQSGVMRIVPPEIRRACQMLGVKPEDINQKQVMEAWKREMSKPGVHPDTGGDTEMATRLNTSKDQLLQWLEAQTPKLGKVFGNTGGGRDHGTREQQKPNSPES